MKKHYFVLLFLLFLAIAQTGPRLTVHGGFGSGTYAANTAYVLANPTLAGEEEFASPASSTQTATR